MIASGFLPPQSPRHCRGRSPLETVCWIGLIGLLVSVFLRHVQSVSAEAHDTRVREAGQAFMNAVSILHDEWRSHHDRDIPSQKDIGEGRVRLNAAGWPVRADTDRGEGLYPDRCAALWRLLMAHTALSIDSASITEENGNDFSSIDSTRRQCVYSYRPNQPATGPRRIVYAPEDGSVKTLIP